MAKERNLEITVVIDKEEGGSQLRKNTTIKQNIYIRADSIIQDLESLERLLADTYKDWKRVRCEKGYRRELSIFAQQYDLDLDSYSRFNMETNYRYSVYTNGINKGEKVHIGYGDDVYYKPYKDSIQQSASRYETPNSPLFFMTQKDVHSDLKAVISSWLKAE